MQELSSLFSLGFFFDIIETSIIVVLFFKMLLGKKKLEIGFYIKILLYTTVIIVLTLLYSFILMISLDLFLVFVINLCFPLVIFFIAIYYIKTLVINDERFDEKKMQKSIMFAFFSLVIIFIQFSLFISYKNPTTILIINYFVSLA